MVTCTQSQLPKSGDGEELWLLFQKDGSDRVLLPLNAAMDRPVPTLTLPPNVAADAAASEISAAARKQQQRLDKLRQQGGGRAGSPTGSGETKKNLGRSTTPTVSSARNGRPGTPTMTPPTRRRASLSSSARQRERARSTPPNVRGSGEWDSSPKPVVATVRNGVSPTRSRPAAAAISRRRDSVSPANGESFSKSVRSLPVTRASFGRIMSHSHHDTVRLRCGVLTS